MVDSEDEGETAAAADADSRAKLVAADPDSCSLIRRMRSGTPPAVTAPPAVAAAPCALSVSAIAARISFTHADASLGVGAWSRKRS